MFSFLRKMAMTFDPSIFPYILSGAEYLVAGHSDRKHGRLLVNMKSLVKPWSASLGRKVLTLLKKECNW